jgi:hypothetical protein
MCGLSGDGRSDGVSNPIRQRRIMMRLFLFGTTRFVMIHGLVALLDFPPVSGNGRVIDRIFAGRGSDRLRRDVTIGGTFGFDCHGSPSPVFGYAASRLLPYVEKWWRCVGLAAILSKLIPFPRQGIGQSRRRLRRGRGCLGTALQGRHARREQRRCCLQYILDGVMRVGAMVIAIFVVVSNGTARS